MTTRYPLRILGTRVFGAIGIISIILAVLVYYYDAYYTHEDYGDIKTALKNQEFNCLGLYYDFIIFDDGVFAASSVDHLRYWNEKAVYIVASQESNEIRKIAIKLNELVEIDLIKYFEVVGGNNVKWNYNDDANGKSQSAEVLFSDGPDFAEESWSRRIGNQVLAFRDNDITYALNVQKAECTIEKNGVAQSINLSRFLPPGISALHVSPSFSGKSRSLYITLACYIYGDSLSNNTKGMIIVVNCTDGTYYISPTSYALPPKWSTVICERDDKILVDSQARKHRGYVIKVGEFRKIENW